MQNGFQMRNMIPIIALLTLISIIIACYTDSRTGRGLLAP